MALSRSEPPVLVTGHVGQIFLAGLVVDQVDDECPHDRTSLFDQGLGASPLQADFFGSGKWFRQVAAQ
jgi:hypothetical protein